MSLLNSFKNRLHQTNESNFKEDALSLFRFQATNNYLYASYIEHLSIDPDKVTQLEQIPFLPIEFFKGHTIKTESWHTEKQFLSSGTTGSIRSLHEIQDIDFYLIHARKLFEAQFGKIQDILIFALLPSYQENGHSSLICMVEHLIQFSKEGSGFFLNDYTNLTAKIKTALLDHQKVILFGVGYALLDFADHAHLDFGDLIIIETGGMKGKREEMTKSWFYSILKEKMGRVNIFSEYGMTELLSQAYASDNFIFSSPNSMKILVRELQDPFEYVATGKSGGINVIDLANVHSCAFIETQDLGKKYSANQFEILGRIDNSDIRGCNLMVD